MTGHNGSPSHIAPANNTISASVQNSAIQPSFGSSEFDIPDFLPRASTSGNSAAAASSPAAAAVSSSAPGMALTQEHDSEPLFIPSFLRCARLAHGGMKPETPRGVITIENQNIAGTA